jgi:hypothetical protein
MQLSEHQMMTRTAARINGITLVALVSGLGLGLGWPALAQSGLPATPSLAAQEPAAACSTEVVGAILGPRLGIDFGGEEGRGDVVQLVCKAHPAHGGQTIVALFHRLKDKPRDAEEGRTGVVVAVIDARRRLLHRLHQQTIEDEAIIRVQSGSLSIDTARYNLAPGVRAFGVRMKIGYSPRCAEGAQDNYLTLFVEDGKQLRPVLSALPMSHWQAREGSNVCGDSEEGFEIDRTELSLALSSSSTGGWRDIDVVARALNEVVQPDGTSVTRPGPPKVVDRLRKDGKEYPSH